MKKILALMLAVVMCLALFSACGEKIVTKDMKELDGTEVVKVEDISVSQAYYNFIYSLIYQNMAQYEAYYGEDWENMEIEEGKTIKDYMKESAKIQVEQLAASTVIARENGIEMDEEIKKAVEEQKKQVIDSYGSQEAYVEFLEGSRTTDQAITSYLETYEILNRLFEKITKKGEKAYIADEEIEDQFLEYYKDSLRVQHVLISTMPDESTGAPGKSDAEALKIANEVVAKLDKGEKMDDLIADYGEDPGMSSGQFYVFGPGEMVAEFENASKELKVGEYTKKPVKSDYGYHVIKRYALDKDTDEFENFKVSKLQENLSVMIEEETKNLEIKWEDKKVDEYLKKWDEELKAEKEAAAKEAEEAEEPAEKEESAE